jgi:hypothetical protein
VEQELSKWLESLEKQPAIGIRDLAELAALGATLGDPMSRIEDRFRKLSSSLAVTMQKVDALERELTDFKARASLGLHNARMAAELAPEALPKKPKLGPARRLTYSAPRKR